MYKDTDRTSRKQRNQRRIYRDLRTEKDRDRTSRKQRTQRKIYRAVDAEKDGQNAATEREI